MKDTDNTMQYSYRTAVQRFGCTFTFTHIPDHGIELKVEGDPETVEMMDDYLAFKLPEYAQYLPASGLRHSPAVLPHSFSLMSILLLNTK